MRLKRADGGGEFEVEVVARESTTVRARIDGREVRASVEPTADGGAVITLGGWRSRVFAAKVKDRILVALGPAAFEFIEVAEGRSHAARGLAAPEVTAPMPGKVLRILVDEGQTVGAGAALVILEAMKMETTLSAETPARIKRVRVAEGQMVDHGAVLLELAPVSPLPSPAESGPQDP
jgi:3-methylcrotonyl-CoA carboxylase alpha subunit